MYSSALGRYWEHLKSQGFNNIDDWVDAVRGQQESKNIDTRRTWATTLETFVNSHKGPRTGRLMVASSRNVIVAAVTAFLKRALGDQLESYEFSLGTKQERLQEIRRHEDTPPVDEGEVRRLYGECKNRRDRAILSTIMSGGFGVSEFDEFSRSWLKYSQDILANKVPLRATVTRVKTGISYTARLWDDAVEDLRELLLERQRDLGRPLTKDDPLFTNQSGTWLRPKDVQKLVRRLANRSGVEVNDRSKVSYRIRPHELGRDYFKTQAQLKGVQDKVSEYLLGHKIDPLMYNKFARTVEGQALIDKEASKLRSVLNIRTNRGQPASEIDQQYDFVLRFTETFQLKEMHDKLVSLKNEGRLATVEDLKPFMDELSKRLSGKTSETEQYEYQRIPEDKADNDLNHGWQFVQVLPSGQLLIRRPKKD